MSHHNKIVLAGFIIFSAFVYSSVSEKEIQAQGEDLVVPDGIFGEAATGQTGREILDLLKDMEAITLDESIFSDPVFRSLQDNSIELDLEPKGRPNPFAPIGKDVILDESAPGFATTSLRDIPFSSESEP